MTNSLIPLEAPFPPDVATALAQYPQQKGYILTLFRTFALSLRFLKKCVPNLLDKESPLGLRMREITILRVTANRDCEYEWGVHVAVFSKAAGLTAEQVASTRQSSAACWSPKEQRLIAAIDQLCVSSTLDDNRLAEFQADWSNEEQLEILALCGTYSTISLVANVARLSPEEFAPNFPPHC